MDAAKLDQHKENITPLPSGRSAAKLAATLSTTSTTTFDQVRNIHRTQRQHFDRLLEDSDEADDPLQIYVDYIRWTHDNFPQGANAESGLVSLLEKCTSHFRDVVHYKNDPRYLKVWLEYANYSDSPREVFVYLAKKEIGTQLALYYESFAQLLESQNRLDDALLVYELGVEVGARPLVRLEKSLLRFNQRMLSQQHHIQPSPSMRTALAVKKGPETFESSVAPPLKRQKLDVFQDESVPSLKESLRAPSDAKELGSIRSRTKENTIAAKPWQGEVLRQKINTPPASAKFEVFRDSEPEKNEIWHDDNGMCFTIIRQPGKKVERVCVNMDLLYPSPGEEYCMAELLAMSKHQAKTVIVPLNDENTKEQDFDFSSEPKHASDQRDLDTFTIPLKDSPTKRPNSPTMTMFSRAATNEVYEMFNNAARNLTDDDFDKSEPETTNFDDFITETIHVKEAATPPTDQYSDSVDSSPFIEDPRNVRDNEIVFNPCDNSTRQKLLQSVVPSIDTTRGFFRHDRAMRKIKVFENMTKNRIVDQGSGSIIDCCGDEIYCLRYELGRGGYGVVYLIETERGDFKAVKIESPASQWEFYILNQIHKRVNLEVGKSIIMPESLTVFQDESYLVLNYRNQGTLLDVVNYFRNQNMLVDEVLCLFFAVELLRIVEELHGQNILHGDLKADNCMVRLEDGELDEHDTRTWNKKGLTLIDFGRALDLRFYGSNVQFVSDWQTDNQDCPAMRQGKPWSFDADYFGVAGILHTLLFGDYIQTKEVEPGRFKLAQNFKRYWQVQLWMPLFDMLLNPFDQQEPKVAKTKELKLHRENLEEWLSKGSAPSQLKRVIADVENELNTEYRRLVKSLK